jgi:predicted dehydrogenase
MSTARARVRVVVVGCGDIASTAHLPALSRSGAAELVAVVDSDAGRRTGAAVEYGVPGYVSLGHAMQAAPQAAIVCTPPNVTPSVCEQAIAYGLHVLCEKPMATDVVQGRRLHALAGSSGLVVQVGFTNRFSPLIESLHDAISAGRLGAPLVYTLGAYDERYDAADRHHLVRIMRFLERAPSFVHEGAHLTDYVAFLTGSRPTRVSAAGLRTSREFPSENFVAATVEWANGDLARLEVGWLFPSLPDGHFRVLGPRASAEILRREGRLLISDGRDAEDQSLTGRWTDVSFDRQLAHFVASLHGDAAVGPTTADGLASLELSDAITRSMREGRVVDLDAAATPTGARATVDAGQE